MRWRQFLPECLFIVLFASLQIPRWLANTSASPLNGSGWTSQRKLAARERTRELFYHGYDNYMTFAFPLDELTPLSCSGQGPDWENPSNIAANDVAGNFSLTLIDVLDTLVVLDDREGFERAVKNVIQWVQFDVNTKPQVFETTIRVLGGLLSGHIFASRPEQPFYLPWYRGQLLELAHDLGKRLLPAFSTRTGLPYARINLRRGLMRGETVETCAAGAGSLILEFATLSRLTGDDRFEKAAYKAFFALWNRKSEIGLLGNTINTWNGEWITPEVTGIGAGVDSFYEYALKWYIMSGEIEFLDVWDDAYAAIMRYSRAADGYWYRPVNMNTGDTAYFTVDSLSAFWPGLQVLAGDVQSAIKLHMLYYNLWREHSGLPEVYDTNFKKATSHQYPLRPEFIESTWYLYRATRDPFYLDVGERVLEDIIIRAKVDCGLTGIQDLRTNKRDNRMESFALSETLKYLYLLFDEDNFLHRDDSNYVFTTEGHILTLDRKNLRPMPASRRKMRPVNNYQCPAYKPFVEIRDKYSSETGLTRGIRSRSDYDYARRLVGVHASTKEIDAWSANGWCETPIVENFTSYDFILSADGRNVPEDLSPNRLKLEPVADGFIVHNITGIRTQIVRRLDDQGYDVRKLGHYSVRPGHVVYINDPLIFGTRTEDLKPITPRGTRDPDIHLRVFFDLPDHTLGAQPAFMDGTDVGLRLIAYTAFFGVDLSARITEFRDKPVRMTRGEGLPLFRELSNWKGCLPFSHPYPDSILVVERGGCTFLDKLLQARNAGAAGVIVIGDEDLPINPTASADEVSISGDLSDVGLLLLPKTTGKVLTELMETFENVGTGQVMVAIHRDPLTTAETASRATVREPEKDESWSGEEGEEKKDQEATNPRILYINGHPLLNTRLLV
ncbi:glycoside hydrolase family 47 protein [Macrolepiota fuliginosa MF-IS2]|uniref:alpha-1,2-Mannosidase n=1 Tax=Macrolepiota fuliginosa MF-IS2 TaxID=1400762 RepID=A0A9P5XKL5_9AGAR|nr:glycoside hydrolase family 47 protein [Macrolepiota fuliginosa MF-IS2]